MLSEEFRRALTALNVRIRTCLREVEILASQREDPESVANDVKPHCRSRLISLPCRWIADESAAGSPTNRGQVSRIIWIKNMRLLNFRKSLTALCFAPLVLFSGCSKKTEPVSLFDGETLEGWHAIPRLYVPQNEEFNQIPSAQLRDATVRFHEESSDAGLREKVGNSGVWEVVDGAIVGSQVPGTVLGGYLMSDKKYGDFELTVEAWPDFPIDTGIMIRAHEVGTVGFQILLDYRPNGGMGGVYGNGLYNFRAFPFVINGDELPGFEAANLRKGKLDRPQFKPGFAAPIEDFLKAWKPNDWNTIRIRSEGELPVIKTWINGVHIATFDTATLGEHVENFDAEAVVERLGRKGHIAFEVHDSHSGRERWAPGAVCRWRNVRITEL